MPNAWRAIRELRDAPPTPVGKKCVKSWGGGGGSCWSAVKVEATSSSLAVTNVERIVCECGVASNVYAHSNARRHMCNTNKLLHSRTTENYIMHATSTVFAIPVVIILHFSICTIRVYMYKFISTLSLYRS